MLNTMVEVNGVKRWHRVSAFVPPLPNSLNLPQCSARSGKDNDHWSGRAVQCKKTGLNPAYCLKGAGIEIDGAYYCHLHAGTAALSILLGKR